MKNILSNLKNEKGQSAVEFALVAILLFLLVFGIIEFGMYWFRADLLKGAANVAARTFAVTKDYSKALSDAQKVIPSLTSIATASTTDQVTVTVSQPYNFPVVPRLLSMMNITPTSLGSITTITRTATYRLEP